eukprot:CAMPEP_0179970858 /NCGR_PEP_ID=MMETSP0983-20121128/35593_1 /TAXON_ID=483367 /ORGANISM="non described non described, Strain CCMP 2436" /LENGTH=333 /DNA_ID=CAMNT_0021885693 /DNA_START=424 /DNA_END=1422 /DNA_ORIENTATION=+
MARAREVPGEGTPPSNKAPTPELAAGGTRIRSPEHVVEAPHSQESHIRARLDYAHRAGKQFRWRVQLPLAATGIIGLLIAIVVGVFSVVYNGPILLSIALIMVGPSFLFLALSLTPVETYLVKLGISLCIVVEIFFAAIMQGPVIMHTEETFDRVMAGGSLSDKCTLSYGTLLYDADLRQVPCWYLVAKNTIAFVISLMCVVQAARLALSLLQVRRHNFGKVDPAPRSATGRPDGSPQRVGLPWSAIWAAPELTRSPMYGAQTRARDGRGELERAAPQAASTRLLARAESALPPMLRALGGDLLHAIFKVLDDADLPCVRLACKAFRDHSSPA